MEIRQQELSDYPNPELGIRTELNQERED